MKQHTSSVRMGPISLVSLIIVLCLAVMTVLSVSTAHAMNSSTQRQASSTTDVYRCEQAGQAFLANLDEVLANVRNGSSAIVSNDGSEDSEGLIEGAADSSDAANVAAEATSETAAEGADESAAENTVEATTEATSADEDADSSLTEAASEGESSGEVAYEDQSVETTSQRSAALVALREVKDDLIANLGVDGISAAVEISPNDDLLPSVTATFVTESDRRLSVTLAIEDDATYRILSWKTTTFWNNYSSEETLWSGETTD